MSIKILLSSQFVDWTIAHLSVADLSPQAVIRPSSHSRSSLIYSDSRERLSNFIERCEAGKRWSTRGLGQESAKDEVHTHGAGIGRTSIIQEISAAAPLRISHDVFNRESTVAALSWSMSGILMQKLCQWRTRTRSPMPKEKLLISKTPINWAPASTGRVSERAGHKSPSRFVPRGKERRFIRFKDVLSNKSRAKRADSLISYYYYYLYTSNMKLYLL